MPPTVEPVSATAFSRGAVAHVFCSHAAAVGVGYPREHECACEPVPFCSDVLLAASATSGTRRLLDPADRPRNRAFRDRRRWREDARAKTNAGLDQGRGQGWGL